MLQMLRDFAEAYKHRRKHTEQDRLHADRSYVEAWKKVWEAEIVKDRVERPSKITVAGMGKIKDVRRFEPSQNAN